MAIKVIFTDKSGKEASLVFPIRGLADMFARTVKNPRIEETGDAIVYAPTARPVNAEKSHLRMINGGKQEKDAKSNSEPKRGRPKKQIDPNAKIAVSRDGTKIEKFSAAFHNCVVDLSQHNSSMVAQMEKAKETRLKTLQKAFEQEENADVRKALQEKIDNLLKPVDMSALDEKREKLKRKMYSLGVQAATIDTELKLATGMRDPIIANAIRKAQDNQIANRNPDFAPVKLHLLKMGRANSDGGKEAEILARRASTQYWGERAKIGNTTFLDPAFDCWGSMFVGGFMADDPSNNDGRASKYRLFVINTIRPATENVEALTEVKETAFNDWQMAENAAIRAIVNAGTSELRTLQVEIRTYDLSEDPTEEGDFPEMESLRFVVSHEYAAAKHYQMEKRKGRKLSGNPSPTTRKSANLGNSMRVKNHVSKFSHG